MVISSPTPDPDPNNNQDTNNTPVNTSADLQLIKKGNPSPVRPGEYLIYAVTLINHGPDPAVGVVLTDILPPELTSAEYSLNGGSSWQAWTGSYSAGTLSAGESRTVLIRGIVAGSAIGTITNTASVSSETPDPDPSNNEDTVITPINESADLSVTKTAVPIPVTAGEMITYQIIVSNAGPSAAQNVELSDRIPAEIANPEFAVGGSPNFIPWISPYSIGTLAAGDSIVVTIRGTVASSALVGSLANTATVTSNTPDPNLDNNTDTIEVPVETSADVSVLKRGNTTPAVPGEPFSYTIKVTNSGPSDARNVVLVDAVPASLLSPVFSADGGVTWQPWASPYTIGTLPAEQSLDIIIRGAVSPSATGMIINTAVVSSTTPDPDPDDNTSSEETPVRPSADLSIVKTGNASPVPVGGLLIYTLSVFNTGPSSAENAVITDTLPAGLENAEFSTDGGVTWRLWSGSYSVDTLAANETRSIQIRARVSDTAAGSLVNTATVTSDTPDPNPDNNTSTEVTPIVPSGDLSVIKTGEPNPVPRGGLLVYTLMIANAGPADAENVRLRDQIPTELSNPEFSADGGATWQPWSGVYTLGTLPAGESRNVLIRGTVPDTTAQSILNVAVVTSDTPDPDPGNNTDTNLTEITTAADLSVEKSAQPNPVREGEMLTYTITARNAGPDTAKNVLLYDTLSAGLLNGEYSIDGGSIWMPWSSPYTIGQLAGGETRTVLIRGIVSDTACGMLTNTAFVTSDTPDPAPDNNSDTTDTEVASPPVQEGADLSIVKSAFPNPSFRCQRLTYTLTITNAGPETAVRTVLTDSVPAELFRPVFSMDDGRTWHPWTGSYTVGSLAPGSVITVLISGTVDPCAKQSFLNSAMVSSETFDPNPNNNRFSVTTALWERCCPPPRKKC